MPRYSSKPDPAVAARREKVANMLAKGIDGPVEIAARLGMDRTNASRMAITRDIEAVMGDWRDSINRDVNAYVGQEYAILRMLYREACIVMEKSQAEKTSRKVKHEYVTFERDAEGKPDLTKPIMAGGEEEEKKEQRDGSIAAIAVCARLRDQICKLLGLYPEIPAKVAEVIAGMEARLVAYEEAEKQRQERIRLEAQIKEQEAKRSIGHADTTGADERNGDTANGLDGQECIRPLFGHVGAPEHTGGQTGPGQGADGALPPEPDADLA